MSVEQLVHDARLGSLSYGVATPLQDLLEQAKPSLRSFKL